MLSILCAFSVLRLSLPVTAAAIQAHTGPIVELDYGSIQGVSLVKDTESFLGVPFAQPPVGNLRLNHPLPPLPFSGIRQAITFGNSCPQKGVLAPNTSLPTNPGLAGIGPYLYQLQPHPIVAASEDCLFINVVRPEGAASGANLPVVVWMYGGAFQSGDSSSVNGTDVVRRSLDLKTPVLHVSFNYRINAFGFLAGKEVEAAGIGNLGLYDQRLAFEWVQKYIHLFGGDRSHVVAWGQSSGAISAMVQMVAFNGQLNGLFSGAVMESGSASAIRHISEGQDIYDIVVAEAGCGSAKDTLNCLRQAPYEAIMKGVEATPAILSYNALKTSFGPKVDGVILKQSIRRSLATGKYAKVPVISSNVDDEGTLFSLYSFNLTTDEEFLQYVSSKYLPGVDQDKINELGQLYPSDPAEGSPFDVGSNDTLSSQYKRIAAFTGDYFFQVPRRYALDILQNTQDVWSYLSKRYKYVPGIGSFHQSDLGEFYNLTRTTDYAGADLLINFAKNLNPNVPDGGYPEGAATSVLSSIQWPQYTTLGPSPGQLLTFSDPNVMHITSDDYRVDAMEFVSCLQDEMGL